MTVMIGAEIAGYTHDTENKCVDCVRTWAVKQLQREGYSPVLTEWTTEGLLNALAALWDVDRDYADSDDFPVPFSRQTAETDLSWADHEGASPDRCPCGESFTDRDF